MCVCPGVDEKTIIEILVKRNNEQRQQIKEVYQQAHGKVIRIKHKNCTPMITCSHTVHVLIIALGSSA